MGIGYAEVIPGGRLRVKFMLRTMDHAGSPHPFRYVTLFQLQVSLQTCDETASPGWY